MSIYIYIHTDLALFSLYVSIFLVRRVRSRFSFAQFRPIARRRAYSEKSTICRIVITTHLYAQPRRRYNYIVIQLRKYTKQARSTANKLALDKTINPISISLFLPLATETSRHCSTRLSSCVAPWKRNKLYRPGMRTIVHNRRHSVQTTVQFHLASSESSDFFPEK